MCGLAGIVDPKRRFGLAETRAMAEILAHRGPDDHQDWQDDQRPVALSFRRLAILDLSEDGAQPMHDGPLTIVFNGEIYNYRELRAELESQHGSLFKSASDTEVLLKAFGVWGVAETLLRVNGMYALALLDRRDDTLTLARDRFGEKPLYYTQAEGALFFASELKALRGVRDLTLDETGIALFMRYGFLPAPYTIHKDVRALQPGEYLTFRLDAPDNPAGGIIPRANKVESDLPLLTAFEAALTKAVNLRLRADVPVGVFLSGGIDSSLILLLASRRLARPIPSFTIRMAGNKAYDEADQAARLAGFCGSENHVLTLSEQSLLAAIPSQIERLDQPLADAAIIPMALLSQVARLHVTVALGGEGGDELQAGYTRHAQQPLIEWMMAHKGLARPMLKAGQGLLGLGGLAGLPQLHRQLDKFRALIDTDAAPYDAWMSLWPTDVPDMGFAQDFREADADFYLPHNLLMKQDGATMDASLEGRSPYLDPDLWGVLDAAPRSAWQGKRLAKTLLRGLVPADLIAPAKRGLTLPMADWMRGYLREWGQAQIEGLPDMMRPAALAQWQALQAGKTEHAQPLWALCVFSAWCQAHNVSI